MNYIMINKQISLLDGDEKNIWTAEPEIEIDGIWKTLKADSGTADGAHGCWSLDDMRLEARCKKIDNIFSSIELTLETGSPKRIGKFVLSLEIPELVAGRAFLSCAQDFKTGGGVYKLSEGTSGIESPVSSNLVAALGSCGESPGLLFGVNGLYQDLSYFKVAGGRLLAGFNISRIRGGRQSYGLVFGTGKCPLSLLEMYGELLKKVPGMSRPISELPTGWNSWDYYAGAVSMTELRWEMAAINKSPLKGRLKYFTIDMGWEEGWGVWQTNRRFPGSLRALAKEIESAGFVPGMWVAPLQTGVFSELARTRQDLLLRDTDGNFFMQEGATGVYVMLDYSKDEVCELVGSWFRGFRKAGFRLFKIDFVYEGLYLYRLAQTSMSLGTAEFARKIFKTIRSAVGEDSHIINCCAPPEAALGIADSSRAGIDIHNFWGHIRVAARQIGTQNWMNGRLWTIDPDFAIIRDSLNTRAKYLNAPYNKRPLKNHDDVWMAGEEASHSEMMVWLSLVRLTGGSLFFSDSIARLDSAAIKTLSELIPPLRTPARPIDLFESTPARIWLSADSGKTTIGLFNWDDDASTLKIPDSVKLPDQGTDFWTGCSVVLSREMKLSPHSCLLIEF